MLCFFLAFRSTYPPFQSVVTYPIAKGTIINVAAMVFDPSLAGTHYEGHWVSAATRDELIRYMDSFEPDVRTVVKVSSPHTEQLDRPKALTTRYSSAKSRPNGPCTS